MAMLRTRAVAVASGGLFLGTASLFAVVVFVPTFLQVATGASPTGAGLLMVPMMLATTLSTNLAGRHIARTGRYSSLPPTGLAIMGASLLLLALTASQESRVLTECALVPFGLGFGLTSQVFIVAVQGAVERRELGVATSLTGFFRALGGAVGAAVLGSLFASRAGADLTGAVQAVFAVGALVALCGAVVASLLPRVELGSRRRCRRERPRASARRGPRGGRGDRPGGLGGPTAAPPRVRRGVLRIGRRPDLPARRRTHDPRRVVVRHVPGGAIHTLANHSDAPARYLLLCTPGGFERRFDAAPDGPIPETTVVGGPLAR